MWQYVGVKVTYRTILPDGEMYEEEQVGLHEGYDMEGELAWTTDPVEIVADTKENLIDWLRAAIVDLEKSEVIVDPDVRVNDLTQPDKED